MNAEDYKKLASAKRLETFDVETPSGAVWKMREPPIEQFIIAGKLPASLAAKMASVVGRSGGDKDSASKAMLTELEPEDLMNNLTFGRDLLLYCAVEPRISLSPTDENEIAPEDILPDDFMFLISWVMTGGKSGAALSNFRVE
jgi:hypothetical protein